MRMTRIGSTPMGRVEFMALNIKNYDRSLPSTTTDLFHLLCNPSHSAPYFSKFVRCFSNLVHPWERREASGLVHSMEEVRNSKGFKGWSSNWYWSLQESFLPSISKGHFPVLFTSGMRLPASLIGFELSPTLLHILSSSPRTSPILKADSREWTDQTA